MLLIIIMRRMWEYEKVIQAYLDNLGYHRSYYRIISPYTDGIGVVILKESKSY